jgi:hypothetical protein
METHIMETHIMRLHMRDWRGPGWIAWRADGGDMRDWCGTG